jgi:hypothetical protein
MTRMGRDGAIAGSTSVDDRARARINHAIEGFPRPLGLVRSPALARRRQALPPPKLRSILSAVRLNAFL